MYLIIRDTLSKKSEITVKNNSFCLFTLLYGKKIKRNRALYFRRALYSRVPSGGHVVQPIVKTWVMAVVITTRDTIINYRNVGLVELEGSVAGKTDGKPFFPLKIFARPPSEFH